MRTEFIKLGLLAVLLGGITYAQTSQTFGEYDGRIGINTSTPDATLQVSRHYDLPEDHTQGVTYPNFTTSERAKFKNPSVGTMIFNTEKKCIEIYLGVINGIHQWSCMADLNGSAQSVAVTAQGFEGQYKGGVMFDGSQKTKFKLENNSFSSVSSSFADAVSITNGSASIYTSKCTWQKINGGIPTGSVRSCNSGSKVSLESGESALLTYTMSGIPQTGVLQANFSKLGAEADQNTTVGYGTANILNPKIEYVVSLRYNGTEYQGKIENSNPLIIKIPYTDGSGSYDAVNSAQIATATGESGDTNKLSISIPAGNFSINGILNATVIVDGDGVYNVRKSEEGKEYIIATIPYTLNNKQYNVIIKGIGGIPDRCFGKTTRDCVGYGANVKEHEFIYEPIQAPDGSIWLNNNLGAEYSRVGSDYFNPTYQAGTYSQNAEYLINPTPDQIKRDWRAYGSLLQWQRNPDGHELVIWTGVRSVTPKYDQVRSSSNSWTNPGHNYFIYRSGDNQPWVSEAVNNDASMYNLWQVNCATNPCPTGYHVPSTDELKSLQKAITGVDKSESTGLSAMWQEKTMRIPASGWRYDKEPRDFHKVGEYSYLYTSDANNRYDISLLWFSSSSSGMVYDRGRAGGFNIRCTKNK